MNTDKRVVYHVWFGTKQRKWLLLGEIEDMAKKLVPEICAQKGIDLICCETMPEHVHLLLRLRPHELSSAMHIIKGTTSRRIFQSFPDIKLDAHTEAFWQARYGFKTVPPEALDSTIRYIATQKDRLEKYERR
ncbi:MAG: IS200/IS605 family transposase [Chloroflexi bacterium]|nr:IS200/IS605 family transposase [Chloroflexota bacterium]